MPLSKTTEPFISPTPNYGFMKNHQALIHTQQHRIGLPSMPRQTPQKQLYDMHSVPTGEASFNDKCRLS